MKIVASNSINIGKIGMKQIMNGTFFSFFFTIVLVYSGVNNGHFYFVLN